MATIFDTMKWMMPLLMLALVACEKEENDPPTMVSRTVRYSATSFGNATVVYRKPDGSTANVTMNGAWHMDHTVNPGTTMSLSITYPTSAAGYIIVDGDTLREQVNGGPIYLELVVQ